MHTTLARLSRFVLFFAFLAAVAGFPAFAGNVPANLGNGLEVVYRDHLQSVGALPQSADRNAIAEAAADYLANAMRDPTGRLRVLVHLNGDASVAAVAQALTRSGKFGVAGQSDRYRTGVIDGWVAIADVAAIAKVRGVKSVILEVKPETQVGAVTQQGVVQHRVDQITQDGTGITVGVLSDSYNVSTGSIHEAQDIASGDLPGVGNPLGNVTPVTIVEEISPASGADEGRAMLQLIHDMAPKARLGFGTAFISSLGFADNIRSLAAFPGAPRIVPGFKADIVVDDVIYLTEPMFSDGLIAQAVNDVTSTGTHYFSSAGNQPAIQAYASDFRFIAPGDSPTTGTNINLTGVDPALYAGGFHNFRSDGTRDIAQTIMRTTGNGTASSRLVFQWDDPYDKITTGTLSFSDTGNFTGTPLDYLVPAIAGTPVRVTVFADVGSAYDAIVTITDPFGAVVIADYDTGTDETIFFTPAFTGNYTVTLDAFGGTTGPFTIQAYNNSLVGVTTDYNVLWFRADTGAFISAVAANNFQTNQPVEFASTIPFPSSQNSLQMVIVRANTPTPANANRLRYVFYPSSGGTVTLPAEYFSYQYPVTYGHSTAALGHGVAAYSAFRPRIPESFTSPGPVTIALDTSGNRLSVPEVRQQPAIAALDGGNTTFFVSDSANDVDTFPNFFGTSAAAPNAAAIAALVLQAKGGPGSVTVPQMKSLLISSAMPHDLDPQFSRSVIHTNGGTLTITVNADPSNTSASYAFGALDNKVVNVSYVGAGSVASININLLGGNTTGGNVNTIIPGLAFDTRSAAAGGLPFITGPLVGFTAGDITAGFSSPAPSPSVAGQFYTLGLTFAAGSFIGGRSFTFNVDRDEQTTASLSAPATAGGNSADLWGPNVDIPAATLVPGGVTVTGTMADGTPFSGTFVNRIGSGYSSLDGFGFLSAQRAVAVALGTVQLRAATSGSGTGTVTSDPAGIVCPGTCSFDFVQGAGVTFTAVPDVGSLLTSFIGCDMVVGPVCTINPAPPPLAVPRTVLAIFTAITAPDSPIIMGALRGNGQATISFNPPGFDGGSPITGYTATCMPDTHTATGLVTSLIVGGLTNGTTYSCSVTATNASGTSPPSGSLSVTPATVPDAPTIGTATASSHAVSVTFTPPGSNGGSAITGYTATCGSQSNSGASSPIVVSSLPNGTPVTCTVVATNNVGSSAASDPSNSVTPLATDPPTRGDFDGTGKGDLVFHHTDGRTAVWLMDGPSVTSSAGVLGAGTAWQVAHIADLSGDGKSDLVWQNADGRVTVYIMDGLTAAPKTLILPAGGWTVTQAGDLNGDDKADLVFQHTDGTIAAWLMDGTAMSSGATILGPGTGWSVTKVADFNGDGKKDLLFTHTDGRVAIWLMDGLTPTTQNQILNAGTGWTVTHTADLNGDGEADLIWQHTDGRVAVWLMNGAAMDTGTEILNAGTGWSVTRTGDFDADGKADLLFEHTDGRVAIFLMNGLTPATTTQILNAGGGWTAKRVADLNGDGKSDIVWENVDGRVAVWLMNGTAMSSGAEILGPGTGWSVSSVSQ